MSTNQKRTKDLYEKARKIDFIEYVHIYPHRIHYDSAIYYIKDEEVISIFPESRNTIDIKAPEDIVGKKQVFDALEDENINHIFVRFSENMDNGSIFDVVRNISRALKFL